jgi:sodium-dependent dicarboxylate transporter 2/3/5
MASSMGGMATIIGSPANAMTVGILENEGITVSFLSWMIYGLPVAIVLTALICWLLLKIYVKTNEPLSLGFLDQETDEEEESPFQQKIVIGVFLVTLLLWLTSSWHGVSVAAVSAIPLVVLTLTRVLTSSDMKALPWDTLFLVAGGLSLGAALQSTEILNHYVNQFKDIAINTYVFILIFALVSNIFAGLMSNAASTMILVPLGMTLLPGLEKEIALSIALAASTAIFLPISTTANAIVYSTKLLDQKDFRLVGLLIGLVGPVLAMLWVLFIG